MHLVANVTTHITALEIERKNEFLSSSVQCSCNVSVGSDKPTR